jgi:hypothetical protein
MKHIKTFESYDYLPEVIRNVEQMLLQIEDFEFSTKVNLESQKDLVIEIKKNSQEFQVFFSDDIKETLIDINQYLTLGEGIKEIYVHTSEPRERDNFKAEAYVAPKSKFIDIDTTEDTPEQSLEKILKATNG